MTRQIFHLSLYHTVHIFQAAKKSVTRQFEILTKNYEHELEFST